MKKFVQLMGIATVGLAAGLANAEPLSTRKVESKTTTVSFSRAEVETLDGAKDLYVRLRGAAQKVCSEVVPSESVYAADYRACVSTALDGAVHDAKVPLVSLLHGDRSVLQAMVTR